MTELQRATGRTPRDDQDMEVDSCHINLDSSTLAGHHLSMLCDGSGVSMEMIVTRGYRTVTKAADLLNRGFAGSQCRSAQLPGLLIPIYGPDGSNGLYQFRPDNSRVEVLYDKPLLPDGTHPNKVIKYETPKGARLRLDCPPLCHKLLSDVNVRLFITEGIKKADALAARGACVIGLLGVWNWRDKRGPLPDWEYVPLKGRQVVIVYDNDVATKTAVYKAMLRLKGFLESRGAIVKVIYLPKNDGEKLGVDDWLVQGHTLDDLLTLSSELKTPDLTSRLNDAVRQSSNPNLPGIIVSNRQLRDNTLAALNALAEHNHPAFLFARAGKIVRVVPGENGSPRIDDVSLPALRVMLSESANFFTAGRDRLIAVSPPRDLTEGIMGLGQWPLPTLLGVVPCPQIRPNGSILERPGYDAFTRTIYAPASGLLLGIIPDRPISADVQQSLKIVTEPFDQFPFVTSADRTNFIGLLLTAVVRTAVAGPVPLGLITAPTPGSGKSLLVRAAMRVATGTVAPFANWTSDESELRKVITTFLRTGSQYMVFDNVSSTIRSDVLSQCLTAEVWQDRLLGGNTQVELPNRSIWLATGNNLEVGGDLARRCFRIAIDPRLPHPWERNGFVHHDLIAYIAEQRGMILTALLTMARAWYAAGCPAADVPPLGSFEEWTRVIGGILQCSGLTDFLGNRADLYQDTDAQEWGVFLTAWHERFKSEAQKLADVVQVLRANDGFAESLPGFLRDTLAEQKSGNTQRSLSKQLGLALKRVKGRQFGENDDWITVRSITDRHSKTNSWRVERNDSAGSAGSADEKPTPTRLENRQSDQLGPCSESESGGKLPPHYPRYPQDANDDEVQIVDEAEFMLRPDAALNVFL